MNPGALELCSFCFAKESGEIRVHHDKALQYSQIGSMGELVKPICLFPFQKISNVNCATPADAPIVAFRGCSTYR